MRKVRILHLDGNIDGMRSVAEALIKVGVEIEIHPWSERAGAADAYHTSAEGLSKITETTRGKEVDLVIIGNNMGAGLKKVRSVATDMRNRTIVTWSTPLADAEPYGRLGIQHFAQRSQLFDAIRYVLKL